METKLVIVDIRSSMEALMHPEVFCSEGRLSRCAGIKNEKARLQGYAAELALSYALSGSELRPPVYRYIENGKPVIDCGFISLSHSGNFAVCAYSPVPVGVDIEEHRAVRPSVSKRLLSDSEAERYDLSTDEHFLLKKFVMKEAYLKMTGEGITGGLRDIEEQDGIVLRSGIPSAFFVPLSSEGFIGALVSLEKTEVGTIFL